MNATDAAGQNARPRPAIRCWRERLVQTLWFEALGVAIVSPLYAAITEAAMDDSVVLLSALSVAVMGWSALFNTAFDRIEYFCLGRLASDRRHGLRVLHTIGHETTTAVVTWPLIVALTPFGWLEALLADVGLSLTYAVYGYCFHLGFDRLRPVRLDATRVTPSCSRTAMRGRTPSPA
jgi:uncharacterized membrane protein